MAYCGAIGSVNVLEFMSTDLFDEAQENPFLLAPVSAGSPATQSTRDPGFFRAESGASSPGSSSPASRRSSAKQFALELPLHDPQDAQLHPCHRLQQQQPSLLHPPHLQQPPPSSPASASPSSSPRARTSVTFNLPKSILKRQSSYESNASTAPSDTAETLAVDVDVNETELHKLLYSLARFSVASEPSTASSPDCPQHQTHQYPQRQHSISQSMSSDRASSAASSLWLRDSPLSYESPPHSPSSADETRDRYMLQCHSTGRATLKTRQAKKSKSRSRSVDRAGYDTDPGEYDDDNDDYGDVEGFENSAARSRASVSFQTVKNLLRGGGGGGGRASRIIKRAIPDLQRKSVGTVSSRLKVRQKFARPTILTDAYHRVSTMRLGTKPMPAKVKHVAFPLDPEAAEWEADPGMPSPKGQLRAASLVMLDTLDKIGTRAACPVHLIAEESPDYTNVPARVDSHNHIVRAKHGLRRPSAWLVS